MESKHRCTHKEINAQQMYNFFALYHSSTYTFILWTLLSSPLPLSLQNRRIAYVVGALYILLLFLNFINYFIWNNWRLKSFIYHSRLQRAKHNFIRLVKRQSRFFLHFVRRISAPILWYNQFMRAKFEPWTKNQYNGWWNDFLNRFNA